MLGDGHKLALMFEYIQRFMTRWEDSGWGVGDGKTILLVDRMIYKSSLALYADICGWQQPALSVKRSDSQSFEIQKIQLRISLLSVRRPTPKASCLLQPPLRSPPKPFSE